MAAKRKVKRQSKAESKPVEAPTSISGLAKIIDSKLVKRVYSEGLSSSVKEAGGLITDVMKGLRLFTAPFVLAARFRARLLGDLEECRKRVPVERQVMSPSEVAGPTIEHLKHLEDTSPLRTMYLNLLTASIDSARQRSIHPAFTHVLAQLSRDEVVVLEKVREVVWFDYREVYDGQPVEWKRVENKEADPQPLDLAIPENFGMYLDRLKLLGLIVSPHDISRWRRHSVAVYVTLTSFAARLLEVCSPDAGVNSKVS